MRTQDYWMRGLYMHPGFHISFICIHSKFVLFPNSISLLNNKICYTKMNKLIILLIILPTIASFHFRPNKVEFMVNSFDREPMDGGISVEEIDQFLENEYKIAINYFPKADQNGDGKVDMLERSKLLENFLGFDLKAFPMDQMAEKLVAKVNKMQAAMRGESHMENFEDLYGSFLFYQVAQFYAENEDGSITTKQFVDLPINLQMFKYFVRDADKNGDGDGKADRKEMLDLLDSMKKGGKKEKKA